MPDQDKRLYQLAMGIEVSARYHEWMRARYETLGSWIKFVSIIGAAIAFASVFASGVWWTVPLIAVASAIVGFVNIIGLVFGFDQKARHETELYGRFKDLQAAVLRHDDPPEGQIGEWDAEAQIIRKDELPTFWAVYAKAWNQAVEKRGLKLEDWGRRVGRWKAAAGWLRHYLPEDFPPFKTTPSS